MLAVSHSRSANLSTVSHGVMDEPGTINPAALNSSISPGLLTQPTSRGTKRSRSPDNRSSLLHDGSDNSAHKRNRQPADRSNSASQMPSYSNSMQTPQSKPQSAQQPSPSRVSPARSATGSGSKPAIVKALPTVRDHTTDQLGPEGDEYIPRETDADGEKKVDANGHALEGRRYKCRTFNVPNRGEKLFMLATECARVLSYRDSYLLFNKNRSLFKIIANQQEKDNLITQDILPYSYRSRQIAIVTARSMFRQFGSRVIEGGRRVRDDYWEAKARKQGFTEDDLAGEKRPGAARAREAAAAEAQHVTTTLTSLPQGEIIYSNAPGIDTHAPHLQHPGSLAPLPMIHIAGDERSTFGNIIRPRQEVAGPPYQDRIQPSNPAEILGQSAGAADYNKHLAQTRAHRAGYLDDYWRRTHEQPQTEPQANNADANAVSTQSLTSPPTLAGINHTRTQQQDALPHVSTQMMPQPYHAYPSQHNTSVSPVQNMHRPMPSAQLHQSSPSLNMGVTHRQTPSYGYQQGQLWSTPQPQPSPLNQTQHAQYTQAPSAQQQPQQQTHQHAHSQHQQHQHQQSPLPPPTQQATHMPPPQMHQSAAMSYGQMNQMATNSGYTSMNRNIYSTPQSSQQFSLGPQNSAGQASAMQGWPNQAAGSIPDWQRYQ